MNDASRLVAMPKLEFPYQVVRPDGLPDVPLTLFAREQMQSLSASSVPLYLREIVAFINWSANDTVVQRYNWCFDGPPTDVRNMLREYLTVAAKCKLTTRADGLGMKATYIVQAAGNTINIRTLLSRSSGFRNAHHQRYIPLPESTGARRGCPPCEGTPGSEAGCFQEGPRAPSDACGKRG
jgi:hypothetical protein